MENLIACLRRHASLMIPKQRQTCLRFVAMLDDNLIFFALKVFKKYLSQQKTRGFKINFI